MSKLISQSEVDSFLSCRRRHFMAHGEKIKPQQYSGGLNRGLIGHDVLAEYYQARKDGHMWSECKDAALEKLNSYFSTENLQVITELTELLVPFWQWSMSTQSSWEIVAVEEEYRYQVPGTDLVFPFKVDMIYKDINGRLKLLDHKFVQDYYTGDLINILPQLAKYTGVLRRLGYPIHDGQYQMIRTRKLSQKNTRTIDERMKIVDAHLKEAKIEHYLQEQFSAMLQIDQLRTKVPLQIWRDQYALRSANQFNCRTCPYQDLCYLDLIDGDREKHIRAFYEPNDYGYEEDPNGKSA